MCKEIALLQQAGQTANQGVEAAFAKAIVSAFRMSGNFRSEVEHCTDAKELILGYRATNTDTGR